jgi:sphingomyelin phosphodiesterase
MKMKFLIYFLIVSLLIASSSISNVKVHATSSLLEKSNLNKNILIDPMRILTSNLENITCSMCEDVTKYIAPLVSSGISRDVIKSMAFTYCFVERIECNSVSTCYTLCKDIIDEYGTLVIDLLVNSVLTPTEVCSAISLCPVPPPSPRSDIIPVPSNLSDSTGQKEWPFWNETNGMGTIVHISDIHLDSLYTVGSNTQCGQPLCCRAENGPGKGNNTAGLFGDYNCDTPQVLFNSLIEFIQKLAPDFILYTGDDPAHDVWEQSKDKNVASMIAVMSALTQAFPTLPIFSAVGNHEAFPVDQFFGPGADSWLYANLSRAWANSLAEDAFHTINYGGYYQNLIRPGLRVISLNTNVYATGDFYTKYQNMTDYSSQFAWLSDVLYQCEQRNEKAILIGHSEPRHWFDMFNDEFNLIISNYSHVISNTFFGHTHEASVSIFHSNSSSTYEPLVVSYVAGSITPYTNLNPGFRVYNYDREQFMQKSYLVEDYFQYWVDLPTANAQQSIDWTPLRLQATVNYSLVDLSPKSWTALAQSFQKKQNQNAYFAYETAFYKGANLSSNPWESIQSLGCDILTISTTEYSQCMQSINATSLTFVHEDRCEPSSIVKSPEDMKDVFQPSIQVM